MSLSLDTANQVINDQEETIASLKDKLLAMEDERDLAEFKSVELLSALRRIECSNGPDSTKSMESAVQIARTAIDAYQAK